MARISEEQRVAEALYALVSPHFTQEDDSIVGGARAGEYWDHVTRMCRHLAPILGVEIPEELRAPEELTG